VNYAYLLPLKQKSLSFLEIEVNPSSGMMTKLDAGKSGSATTVRLIGKSMWHDVKWSNLTKPLYSSMIMALFHSSKYDYGQTDVYLMC
jgi:hypothetical protein